MSPVEAIGYIASSLVFITFYMSTMMALRSVAVASNFAFMAYGYLGELEPILILHAILLPLNIWRLYQGQQLMAKVRRAARGDLSFEGLMSQMTRRRFKAGDMLFRKGEPAREMYMITEGTMRHVELGLELSRGSLVGEIGMFSPSKQRTGSIVAVTDVEVMALSEERVIALYNDNREFGYYLISLITKRLVADVEALEAKVVN